jgi:hypothetical protein
LIKARESDWKNEDNPWAITRTVENILRYFPRKVNASTLTEGGRNAAEGFDTERLAPSLIVSTTNAWTPILPDTVELAKTTLTVVVGRTRNT